MIHADVEVDHCRRCGGAFFDPGEARTLFGPEVDPATWRALWATTPTGTSRLRCPRDEARLEAHHVRLPGKRAGPTEVEVDTCPTCQGLWLDAQEGSTLRHVVKEAAAHAEARASGEVKPGVPAYLFQVFTSLPIEVWNPVRRPPVLVYGLVAVLVGVYFFVELPLQGLLEAQPGLLLLIPKELFHGEHVWTLFTSGFLHGGIGHLLGNLYFLWVFGDNVEDTLGRGRFLTLYLVAMVAGALAHAALDPGSEVPMLGASGAIAGLMGAYVVLFPKVKVWLVLFFIRFRLGVTWYLLVWVLMQLGMGLAGERAVAWMAHLGGFFAGVILAFVYRGGEKRLSSM
ncbi:MAG: rhomboid family intramembrane serine protease [Myxococcales bacterium]|nr:rhomboid family intramembrane serine protease [Myxococcales bacterium]MCB9646638.1 rhomboid family intramembrane serine protease [Deltaproteobacteria bacterium]